MIESENCLFIVSKDLAGFRKNILIYLYNNIVQQSTNGNKVLQF